MTAPAKNASIVPKIRLIAPPHTMEVNAASDALFSSPAPSLWLMTTDAPFRELSEAEDKEMVDQINASGADIIWVGLGAPKQEKWMYAHKDHVNGVMIGVGAGFDYHAGNIKRAPGWMQKLSLEWLYRLLQDPKRLFKRYLVTNTRYLWLIHRK